MTEKYIHPSAEECEKFLDHVNDHWKARDIARSPHASVDVLRQMAVTNWNGYTYLVRAAIMENENVPEDLVLYLMSVAGDRHEWGAIYRYWADRLGVTVRSFDYETPDGFPFELLSGQPLDDDVRARMVLETMPRFAEHMWHELASRNLLELDYWADSIEGDLFGPMNWAGSGHEFILYRTLGQGYFTTWIDKEGNVDIEYGLGNLADYAEEYFEGRDWTEEVSADEPFPTQAIALAAAFGQQAEHLTVNTAHEDIQDLMNEALGGDETSFDFEVFITGEPLWTGSKWGELAPEARKSFTENVIAVLPHPYLGGYGFAAHLLALIACHPSTEKTLVAHIRALGLENVAKALLDQEEIAKKCTSEN